MKYWFSRGAAVVLCLAASQLAAAELRIAVAANFAPTLQLIKQRFEQQQPHKLTLIRGSTGKLYAQIKHGAPYDVFLAADSRRPALLEQQGLVTPGSRYTYATGQLALWSPAQDQQPLARLQAGDFNKLAIANPKTAPYGSAAVEVLQHMQLYPRFKAQLVYGENIAQTFQFVQSGSASLGFVALSQVKPLTSEFWLPPLDSYQPLQQQLVILKSSAQQQLAKSFVEFMQGAEIKRLIRLQGYQVL